MPRRRFSFFQDDGFFQVVNRGFQLLDDGVELGDFYGVLALLVFAEAEDVGLVLGTPAVEVFLVFANDGGAELLECLGERRDRVYAGEGGEERRAELARAL